MNIPRKNKIAVSGLVALTFMLLIVSSYSMIDVISPEDMTRTAIGETFARIEIYARKNNKLPARLTSLPERPGYMNKITDAWDAPLIYIHDDKTGIVTLMSYGADGVKGGNYKNTDIFASYKWKATEEEFIAAGDN